MPTVFIDGEEYRVKPGRNMLEAALDHGLNLPYFCWHPALRSVGACRMCAVRAFKDENDKHGRIQMACMTPANEGTRVSINDPEAVGFRRYISEWLMLNHPHDCPVCDEGGECHLQDMTTMTEQVYRRYRGRKRTWYNQDLGPFVNHEMNRCIECWRCVRFYRHYAGGRDFDVFGSRNRLYFGREKDGVLQSEFSGNLVEVCPTGVFDDKTLMRHYTRKWDLETAPSVCIHCSIGCNTIPGARYNELRRIRARYNAEVNGYFLCDRGRYGYEFVNDPRRLRDPLIQTDSGCAPASWEEALARARQMLQAGKGIVGIGSPRASLEANFALKKLVGTANFSTGLSAFDQEGAGLAIAILWAGPMRTPSLAEVEQADVVLILGADPTNEAPMLDLALRQAMQKAPLEIARNLKIPDWDAHAVANALQGARGKLYAVAPWAIKLEEIGTAAVHTDLPGVTAFVADVQGALGREDETTAGRVASALQGARQPLIATSISAGTDVLNAAARLAAALCEMEKQCWLSVIVPEANTVGVAMLGGLSVPDALQRLESGAADTLVILENDLRRRVGASQLGSALQKVRQILVLDCLKTGMAERAAVCLPVSAYVETDGTFVNNEGRAQRFYQVFVPPGEQRPSWWALQALAGSEKWATYEDALRDLAAEMPAFAPAAEASLPSDWRSPAGQKVARMSHRFSGRTAKDADRTVFEPRPPDDPATPFAFSMEGDQNPPPGPLVPRFWWPGWNSVNSLTKFQIEVNGPLQNADPGRRLIEPDGERGNGGTGEGCPQRSCHSLTPSLPAEVWLIPRPAIFGSEELSRLSPGIAGLAPAAAVSLHPEMMRKLGVGEGQPVAFTIEGETRRLPARPDESLPMNVASVPANLEQTLGTMAPVRVKITGAA